MIRTSRLLLRGNPARVFTTVRWQYGVPVSTGFSLFIRPLHPGETGRDSGLLQEEQSEALR